MSHDEFRKTCTEAVQKFARSKTRRRAGFCAISHPAFSTSKPITAPSPIILASPQSSRSSTSNSATPTPTACSTSPTPPETFDEIIQRLSERRQIDHSDLSPQRWERLIIEKPFGHDLATARQLNDLLHKTFSEEQIFRIDHYLGKETVQNLMVMRFANSIFEPIWNHNYIDHIQITVSETLGVGSRGGYYDKSGALRDMVQNHLFQLMSLVAMEPPAALDAISIRDEKVKVYKSIRPVNLQTVVRGQYAAGQFDGQATEGYRKEKGVPAGIQN
jgi:glucose-6-phosphate 1-dehydrogenase